MERKVSRLLVVEDDGQDSRRLQVLLSSYAAARFTMRHAASLHEALEAAAQEPFDAVLLDLGLPDSEGLDTLRRFHEAAEGLPIIVLTSLDDEALAARAVEEGAQDYIFKSDLQGELLARAIRYAIGRNGLRLELRRKAARLEASESNFRNVLTMNVDGIIVVDNNGIVRFANKAAEELLGKPCSAILGQLLCIPLVKDDTTELSIVRTRGETAFVESRIVRSRWEGELAYIVTLRDVTARRRLEEELEEARRREQQEKDIRFDIIIRGMDEGVLVAKDGLVHFANNALSALLGVCVDDLVGKPVEKAFDDDGWRGFFRRFIAGGQTALRAEVEVKIGGGVRHLNAMAETIVLGGGAEAGFVCVFTDITHFREMDRLKNELIGFVSHELRGPLTVIKGYVSTILMRGYENIKPQADEFLAVVNSELNRITRLTDTYLDISRIERGRSLELAAEEIDAGELIAHAVAIVGSAPLQCSFATSVGEDCPRLWGDRDKLLQVLYNLLSNAGKNSPAGGTVNVEVKREDGSVRFEVADRGRGIPKEEQDRLFTPFFQSNGGSRLGKGVGLGLYLSKRLVESHGGKIGIDTSEDLGTRAWFTIPAGR